MKKAQSIEIVKDSSNGQWAVIDVPSSVQPQYRDNYLWSCGEILKNKFGGSAATIAGKFAYYNGAADTPDVEYTKELYAHMFFDALEK